jgi:polyhydroxyalkanoate synthesis regulator phasin
MQDALRTYLELAMGLTDVSRKKVRKVVKDAVGKGNATADQVRTMTTELVATNSANREALTKLVKFEVDRALGVVGLATAEEVAQLTTRVRDLERALREAEMRAATSPSPATSAPARKTARKAAPQKTAAQKTVAKKAPTTVAKRTAASSAPAKASTAKVTPAAKKATASKATASKATASKTTAKRTTAKKTVARKAQP